MYVFGINLPVAEILFVIIALFIAALAVIIVQLVRMARHVRILDETTLEIRRYEEAEEVTLRALETTRLTPAQKRRVTTLAKAAAAAERSALKRLMAGEAPAAVKRDLLAAGVPDHLATRAVNDASYWLDRAAALETAEATRAEKALKKA